MPDCPRLFYVSNDGFTRKQLICSWICLILASGIYFSSLISYVVKLNQGNSLKWNFYLYIGTTATLFLLILISNAMIITTKSDALSTGDRRASIQSSRMRSRAVEGRETRLRRMPGAEGFSHQNDPATKTPPPPYEYLPRRNTGGNQPNRLAPNERPNQESSSEDVKELLNKILLAVNNSRTFAAEQLQKTLEENCNCRKTQVAERILPVLPRVPQQRGTVRACSGSGIYPQLPEKVLEHIRDPDAFIRALPMYQNANRIKQLEEMKRKATEENRKQLERQELHHKKFFQNHLVNNEEERISIDPTSSMPAQNLSLKPTSQNLLSYIPNKILQQKWKSKAQLSFQRDNYASSGTCPPEFLLSNSLNFNSGNKPICSTKALESDFSSQLAISRYGNASATNEVRNKDHDISNISQKIPLKHGTFTKKKASQHVPRLQYQKTSDQSNAIKGIGSSEVLGIESPTASQEDLRPQSPRIVEGIEPGNGISIPVMDHSLNRSEQVPGNSKPEEPISWIHFQRNQANSCPNMNLRQALSSHALHERTSGTIEKQTKTELKLDSYPLVDMVGLGFSRRSFEYKMNPKKWLDSWNNTLHKISNRDTSTLLGSRL